jgi:hypothetical protein
VEPMTSFRPARQLSMYERHKRSLPDSASWQRGREEDARSTTMPRAAMFLEKM